METSGQEILRIGDLQWLCFFLTGRRLEHVIETASPGEFATSYFSTWIVAWSRRVAISRALAAVRNDLLASAHRTRAIRFRESHPPAINSSIDRRTSLAGFESVLLSIDVFPRAVLLLSVFEGIPNEDLTVLLDASRDLVEKARSIGLNELACGLSISRDRGPVEAGGPADHNGARHV